MTPDPPALAARWRAVLDRATPWEPPAVPTLVVVPHPDDEVLLFADLVSRQRRRGVDVTILAVTDGEAAYADVDRRSLAARRRGEQVEALDELGVRPDDVVRLGLPDGAVRADDPRLEETLRALLPGHGLVAAPFPDEGHGDHDACGEAAARLTAAVGRPLVHGLFWTWHWRTPAALAGWEVLRLPADDQARATRLAALAHHTSQVTDAVAGRMLDAERLVPAHWQHQHLVRRSDA